MGPRTSDPKKSVADSKGHLSEEAQDRAAHRPPEVELDPCWWMHDNPTWAQLIEKIDQTIVDIDEVGGQDPASLLGRCKAGFGIFRQLILATRPGQKAEDDGEGTKPSTD